MLSDSKKEDKKIKINISMLTIKVDNQELKILPDYNVGHTLTIFNKTLTKGLNLENKQSETKDIQYTNYNVKGNIYLNNSISLIGVDKDNHIDLKISIILLKHCINYFKRCDSVKYDYEQQISFN
jgi:hypothetical protein